MTIVIATFRRAQLLQETLTSLARALERAAPKTEILIIVSPVDAETISAAEAWCEGRSGCRVLIESLPGLSAARNRGVREATGDVIIFVDDDVEFAEGWLKSLLREFDDEGVDIAGGRVLPYRAALPPWLPHSMQGLFSIFDHGSRAHDRPTVLGCNFAVRKFTFKQHGGFDQALGRRGEVLLGNEENDLCRRVRRGGGRIRYAPEALVYHKIGDRLTRAFALKMAESIGVSNARMHRKDPVVSRAMSVAKESVKLVLSAQLILRPLLSARKQVAWEVRRALATAYLRTTLGMGAHSGDSE